ncbi:MAG: lyase family protein, partial [Candidatus Freyarchaeota archaeon]
ITAVDLSRLAEDLILWSSLDFNFIDLPDQFSSTSSIMPQKKNPEVLEVIRARTGHVLGDFIAAATILKAVPSGYNLDFQEITPKLWETLDETVESVNVLSKLIVELKVNKDEILDRCSRYFFTSTELANMLTRKYGVPFRIAHKIVGLTVKRLIEKKLTLQDLTPEFLSEAAKEAYGVSLNVEMEDIRASINPSDSVGSHKVRGGPSPIETKEMLRVRERRTVLSRARVAERKARVAEAFEKLRSTVSVYVNQSSVLAQKQGFGCFAGLS